MKLLPPARAFMSALLGRPFQRRAITISAIVLVASGVEAMGAAPVVKRVEPPGWWIGHTHNPVRVMVTGEHLNDAKVEAADDLTTSNVSISRNGNYLFVDLGIAADAKPGESVLRVNTKEGTAETPFELMNPLQMADRFKGFSSDDVIYLLMPDRFADGDPSNDDPSVSRGLLDRTKPRYYHGGDFKGIEDHLPYLRDLGVTTLWLTPWYDNVNHLNQVEKYTDNNQLSPRGRPSTDYHGYGAVDFYGVEEHFGSMGDLRELIHAARRSGLKLIQDQVANHTGPYHPWVRNPPTPTWFNGSAGSHLNNNWQVWTVAATNPPPEQLKSTLEGWFINVLPDLNQNDSETAASLIQNSLWWVGMTGVDAVRQDTLPYVPRAHWARWSAALKKQFPHLTILGEMFDGNPELVAFFQGGRTQFDGLDTGVEALFDFPLYFAIREVFAGEAPMSRLTETLAADTNYVNPDRLVTFLGLHDTARFMSEPGATIARLEQAFTFLLTVRGTPLIYYGDEIAMRGGKDPHNRRDFPGGWPGDPVSAFDQSGRTAEQEAVHGRVKRLLELRRELMPLRRGNLRVLSAGNNHLVYLRSTGESLVVIALNNGDQSGEITFNLPNVRRESVVGLEDLLGSNPVKVADGRVSLVLPGYSAAVLVPGPDSGGWSVR